MKHLQVARKTSIRCRNVLKAGFTHYARSPHSQPTPSLEVVCGKTISVMNHGKGGAGLTPIPERLLAGGMRQIGIAPKPFIKIPVGNSTVAFDTSPPRSPCNALGRSPAERLVSRIAPTAAHRSSRSRSGCW
jgi:hypothetical protein